MLLKSVLVIEKADFGARNFRGRRGMRDEENYVCRNNEHRSLYIWAHMFIRDSASLLHLSSGFHSINTTLTSPAYIECPATYIILPVRTLLHSSLGLGADGRVPSSFCGIPANATCAHENNEMAHSVTFVGVDNRVVAKVFSYDNDFYCDIIPRLGNEDLKKSCILSEKRLAFIPSDAP